MKIYALLSLLLVTALCAAPVALAQTPPATTPAATTPTQPPRVNALTIDEQLKLRAAQQKAADDPAVKAALQKRDQAIRDFRAALHAAMIKADPTIAPTLSKIEIPQSQTP